MTSRLGGWLLSHLGLHANKLTHWLSSYLEASIVLGFAVTLWSVDQLQGDINYLFI